MSDYLLLLAPSANRVYTDAAMALTVAELSVFETVLSGPLRDLGATTVAGLPCVGFTAELAERDLALLANVSTRYALFQREGELLRPVRLHPLAHFDDDLITIAIDHNVFIDLAIQPDRDGAEESAILTSDYLADTIRLAVTEETYREIRRLTDQAEVGRQTRAASQYHRLETDPGKVAELRGKLRRERRVLLGHLNHRGDVVSQPLRLVERLHHGIERFQPLDGLLRPLLMIPEIGCRHLALDGRNLFLLLAVVKESLAVARAPREWCRRGR